jgi:hypothetical protein
MLQRKCLNANGKMVVQNENITVESYIKVLKPDVVLIGKLRALRSDQQEQQKQQKLPIKPTAPCFSGLYLMPR